METTNLKVIPDFDGYLINENGQVFSLKNDVANQFSNGMHELKQLKRKYGGPVVGLSKDGNVSILSKSDSGIRNCLNGWSKSSKGMKWYRLRFNFNGLKKLKLTNKKELEKQND